jgi:hypothetical protein
LVAPEAVKRDVVIQIGGVGQHADIGLCKTELVGWCGGGDQDETRLLRCRNPSTSISDISQSPINYCYLETVYF